MNGTRGPRKTTFEIRREQRWRIWLLFALLLGMALVSVWTVALVLAVGVFVVSADPEVWGVLWSWRAAGLVVLVATVASVVYWFSAQAGARRRLLKAMHCLPLDGSDRYHQRLVNVVEEMQLATGAPRVECVTVGTLGMNAFAFSDLRGGGVVGVTEGALARLSRQQLQGVVAHEFAHILSGSHVTVTVACMLFGIHSTLAGVLDDLLEGSGDGARGSASSSGAGGMVIVGAFLLRMWVWLLELAARVTNAALSRERERQADLAAARFTGDPLSLAEALRMIARHPGGAGYVPSGLAPLCIRAGRDDGRWLLGSWGATHPPIGERINTLLLLAHVAPSDFERQAQVAAERFAAKEHVQGPTAAPAAAAASSAVTAPRVGPPPLAGWAPLCPACGGVLRDEDYEGVRLRVCRGCGGRLSSVEGVQRVCARREIAFSDEQRRLADLLVAQADHLRRGSVLNRGRPEVEHVACPECGRAMMRRHYSYEHAVEVDYCNICELYWFERDELEVLQLLNERQVDRGRG